MGREGKRDLPDPALCPSRVECSSLTPKHHLRSICEITNTYDDESMEGLDEPRELARLFKALSDETRLRLVKLLAAQGTDGALCVGALAARLGVTQSAVSQHLAVLRATNLVIDERRGYHVHYRLNQASLSRWRERIQATLGEELARALVG